MMIDRRTVLAGSALLAATGVRAATATPMTVYHDPGCGCCKAWMGHMKTAGFAVTAVPTADMAAVKTRLKVPAALHSCHTAVVGGRVIEGHVPAADVGKLLAARPRGVAGLAVPGMPMGSPGMESADGSRTPYQVIAFGSTGQSVFARHG